MDEVNTRQVFQLKTCSSTRLPVRKADKDMREDVLAASGNPWHKVLDDP
jgi:hypothetical protein